MAIFFDICVVEEAGKKRKKRKEIVSKLKSKYRLVVMNDQTFEEKFSLKLSPLNVTVFFGSLAIFLVVGTIYLIAFTSLREYIPGYADVNSRRNLLKLTLRADSLAEQVKARDEYLKRITDVIKGDVSADKTEGKSDTTRTYSDIRNVKSREDSAFRTEIETMDRSYSLAMKDASQNDNDISSFFFFTPLNGMITNSYNDEESHYGVDIAAQKNEAVKATLDGTVILSTWTVATGYTIQIQHSNNLVSVYMHNSALLKKTGDRINAGEVIAIVGNSGELTSGPHLHFELWHNGTALNPQEYINF